MPKVGGKHFPYSEKGKKAAKAHAKKTGKKIEKYALGGSVDPFSNKNPKGVPVKVTKETLEKTEELKSQGDPKEQAVAKKEGVPISNAMDRVKKFTVGGKV